MTIPLRGYSKRGTPSESASSFARMDSRGRLSPHSTTPRPSISGVLRAFRFGLDVFYFFDLYFCDAMAFHLFDGVSAVFVFKRLAQVRDTLQAGQDESGEGFEPGVAGQEQAVLGLEVADVYRAFHHQDGLVDQRWLGRGDVEFIFDVAY